MKPASLMATVILATVSLAHLLRLLLGVQVTLGDSIVPMWASGVAFVVAGGTAFMLWRDSSRR